MCGVSRQRQGTQRPGERTEAWRYDVLSDTAGHLGHSYITVETAQ